MPRFPVAGGPAAIVSAVRPGVADEAAPGGEDHRRLSFSVLPIPAAVSSVSCSSRICSMSGLAGCVVAAGVAGAAGREGSRPRVFTVASPIACCTAPTAIATSLASSAGASVTRPSLSVLTSIATLALPRMNLAGGAGGLAAAASLAAAVACGGPGGAGSGAAAVGVRAAMLAGRRLRVASPTDRPRRWLLIRNQPHRPGPPRSATGLTVVHRPTSLALRGPPGLRAAGFAGDHASYSAAPWAGPPAAHESCRTICERRRKRKPSPSLVPFSGRSGPWCGSR